MNNDATLFRSAVDMVGIWPAAVDLAPRQDLYVLGYRNGRGQIRLVASGGRICTFGDLDLLNLFVLGPHPGVPDDVHLALEILAALCPRGLDRTLMPTYPVGSALLWVAGGDMMGDAVQVGRLLDTLAFLAGWHRTLEEAGRIGPWPAELVALAGLLHQTVVERVHDLGDTARKLRQMALRPVLAREVVQLLGLSG